MNINIDNVVRLFNNNTGSIQAMSTIILVAITGFYAWATYKMMGIMKKQVVADIFIDSAIIGSELYEDWLKKVVKEKPDDLEKNHYYLQFVAVFTARNKSSGNGSIDKPTLVLRFSNDGFEHRLRPRIKDTEQTQINSNTYSTKYIDLGATIFLRGGEASRVEIEYAVNLENKNKEKEELVKHMKESLDNIEYHIEFSDNLGKKHGHKIDKITGERELSDRLRYSSY